MNKYEDSDLREVLRRREVKRPQIEVPDDFCDRVMKDIVKRDMKKHRTWLYPTLTVAACAIALLTIYLGKIPTEQQDITAQPTIVEQVHQSVKDKKVTPATVTMRDEHNEPVLARKSNSVTRKMVEQVKTAPNQTDSIFRQIAWIESELERVGDSVYMDKLSKTILYDPNLSKIVNEFFITVSDTLSNNDSFKTI